MRADLGPGDVAVLLAQRVDRRVHDQRRDGQARRELGEREDRGVVAFEVAAHEVPRPSIGLRQIPMAPPHPPSSRRTVSHQGQRREIVDHHDIGVERQRGSVLAGRLLPRCERRVGHCPVEARKTLLEPRHGGIEVGIADDDLPSRLDAEVAQERDGSMEDLGRARPEAARAQVQEPSSSYALGEPEQQVDRSFRARRHDRRRSGPGSLTGVLREGLVAALDQARARALEAALRTGSPPGRERRGGGGRARDRARRRSRSGSARDACAPPRRGGRWR